MSCSIDVVRSCSIYVDLVEATFLWTSAQAVLRESVVSIFNNSFPRSPENHDLQKPDFVTSVFRERSIQSTWNFPWARTYMSATYTIILGSKYWALKFLWTPQYDRKCTFKAPSVPHNSWYTRAGVLKLSPQLALLVVCANWEFQTYTLFLRIRMVLSRRGFRRKYGLWG